MQTPFEKSLLCCIFVRRHSHATYICLFIVPLYTGQRYWRPICTPHVNSVCMLWSLQNMHFNLFSLTIKRGMARRQRRPWQPNSIGCWAYIIIITHINTTRVLKIIPPMLVKHSSRDNLLCHSFTRKESERTNYLSNCGWFLYRKINVVGLFLFTNCTLYTRKFKANTTTELISQSNGAVKATLYVLVIAVCRLHIL